jgi:hypothetical protein
MKVLIRRLLSKPVLAQREAMLKSFMERAMRCQATQKRTLEKALKIIQGSQFSIDYKLNDVSSYSELIDKLPIANFERARPYVEKEMRGESGSLVSVKTKIVMFAKTSGTTSASKFIPITSEHLSDYQKCMNIWARSAAHKYPEVPEKRSILNLASTWNEKGTESDIPCGSITGKIFAKTHNMMRAINAIPPQLALVENTKDKYYLILRVALANPDVAVLTTANPTTLLRLAEWMNEWKNDLIEDIRNGTLKNKDRYSSEVLRSVWFKLLKNEKRAQKLDEIIHHSGRLYPKDAWEHLQLLSIWMGGTLSSYLQHLPEYYGDIGMRDHGLSASECKITIPFEDNSPEGVLNVDGAFYEFIHESNIEKTDPIIKLAHELEIGQKYFVILTNLAGLIRYDLRDVVECTGKVGEAPVLKFLNKGAEISNLTGEKLTAYQINAAVKKTKKEFPIGVEQYAVVPFAENPPYYRFYMEKLDISKEDIERFRIELDKNLMSFNIEYRDKRESERLKKIEIGILEIGTWEKVRIKHQSFNNASLEQYKQPCLVMDKMNIEELIRSTL